MKNKNKWTIKVMSRNIPNKCESCDRFDECYVVGSGRMKKFCNEYKENVVFKFNEINKL